ncbi:MAG: SGNH/GDSL hydrolase family protein [Deltaproteobacteria bacterium]|nr:SGNH/GDSL hydrolase family protein [Deltaproteobacteria bacterium]
MKKRALLVGALFLCLLFPFSTSVFAYSQIVAFGDSLSDNGPEDGDGFGRFTDPGGLVWVDYLAQDLGVGLLDMAYGAARTYGNPYSPFSTTDPLYVDSMFGFNWQVDKYLTMTNNIADPNNLYTVWIGGNDLLNLDGNRPGKVIVNAAINIGSAIGALYDAGATDIVLMNMPNLGATPLMNGTIYDTPEYGESLSQGFNCSLAITQAIMEWYLPDLNLFSVDIFALMDEFITSGDLYFDNVTTMLKYDSDTEGQRYLFWDEIHPTTYAHELIADAVYSQVAPVPEPSTIVLMGLGLVGLAGLGRKKFRK